MKNINKNGFTLIEIIASISLVILLFTVSTMRYGYDKVLIDSEIDKLISDIHYIKSININGQSRAYISLDKSKNTYVIYDHNYTDEVTLKHIKIESFTDYKITFNDSGWTTGNTVLLSSQIGKYSLTITAITGVVKVKYEK